MIMKMDTFQLGKLKCVKSVKIGWIEWTLFGWIGENKNKHAQRHSFFFVRFRILQFISDLWTNTKFVFFLMVYCVNSF